MASTSAPESSRRRSRGPARTRQAAIPTGELTRFRNLLDHGRLGSHDYAVFLGFARLEFLQVVAEVTRGIPYRAFDSLLRNTFWEPEVLASILDIPQRTLARRKQEGRFRSDESDRLLRVSRVFGRAVELFEGDPSAASAWLERPLAALGNAAPMEIARTEVGALEVERVILALEHGVFI